MKVRGAVADEDVTQQVIVEDDEGQLSRRQIGILEGADEASVILTRKGARQEPLPGSRREEHHCVPEVDDGYPPALIKPPAMPHCGRHRHLSTCGDQELSRRHHGHLTW
jgi:hypothetical protein